MRIAHATLAVHGAAPALAFYGALGLAVDAATVAVGEGALELVEHPRATSAPTHHVALRVAHDRLGAAATWLAAAAPLLPHDGATRVRWDFWDAEAVYCHDPAGTILELIAFRGLPASGRSGPFRADELLGLAEVGLPVDDVLATAAALAPLGVTAWDGEPDAGFAALGARGATLIAVPRGRGWFPTGAIADAPPRRVVLAGGDATGEVDVGGGAVLVRPLAGGGAPPPTGDPSGRTR